MESPIIADNKKTEVVINICTSSTSNQFMPDNLELPDDTFRMSLDNFSMIGENVTIGREVSVDNSCVVDVTETPTLELSTPTQTPDLQISETQTPDIVTPEVQTPPPENNSPPIIETPKITEPKTEIRKPQTLLQLSLTKKDDDIVFVKPAPFAGLMSPAKMLQFELEATSATPTMKRAAVDFDFFNKNKFEEYFADAEPKCDTPSEDKDDSKTFEETPVIVQPNTIRHEIGYGSN